jgi:ADP-ribose pyrophosphatase
LPNAPRPWEQVSREQVGDFHVFRVVKLGARSPRTGEIYEFHILDLPNWIVTIAQTTDGKFLLVEQYRPGADEMSMEFCAGRVERGEAPIDAALRELKEETGYTATSAEVLAEVRPDPGLLCNRMAIVLARGCVKTGECEQDAGEDVHVRLLEAEDIETMILDGSIQHVNVIAPWYLYRAKGGSAGNT